MGTAAETASWVRVVSARLQGIGDQIWVTQRRRVSAPRRPHCYVWDRIRPLSLPNACVSRRSHLHAQVIRRKSYHLRSRSRHATGPILSPPLRLSWPSLPLPQKKPSPVLQPLASYPPSLFAMVQGGHSPVHEASLIDPALHSPAVLELLDIKMSRTLIGESSHQPLTPFVSFR